MTCELLILCLRMFVRQSLENETDTKADWLRLADKTPLRGSMEGNPLHGRKGEDTWRQTL